ncbi:MAG: hypothetical protein IJL74_02050 [Bacilli bacterium]|nr:hypothetical protein [Bacilli bacterium]
MKENINALDEIHKGACMGKDAISFVLDKVEDKELIKELKKEYKDYQTIEDKIDKIYSKYSDGDPHSTNAMTKAMTWSGIEMKTMTDKTTSKIAELLLQGVNMGIIEGRKILNKKELNNEVHSIASTYVAMQEKSVEALKKFL